MVDVKTIKVIDANGQESTIQHGFLLEVDKANGQHTLTVVGMDNAEFLFMFRELAKHINQTLLKHHTPEELEQMRREMDKHANRQS